LEDLSDFGGADILAELAADSTSRAEARTAETLQNSPQKAVASKKDPKPSPSTPLFIPIIPEVEASQLVSDATAPDVDEEVPVTPVNAIAPGGKMPETLAIGNYGTGQAGLLEPTEEKLVSVFARLSDDGQIHQDLLMQALELSGIRCPIQEWIDEIVKHMTRFTTLDEDEFIRLVKLYVDQQCQEYESAFYEFDSDGSGTIEASELAKLLQWLGITPMDKVVEEIIQEVDVSSKGELDLQGFSTVVALLAERDGFGKAEFERLKMTFDIFDTNKTRSLDTDELVALLSYMAYRMTLEAVKSLLNEVDVDCSGTLSFSEFLIFMRKLREMEILRIKEVLLVSPPDMQELLHNLLQSVGYIAERESVLDAALECGISVSAAAARRGSGTEVTSPRGGAYMEPLLSLSDAYRFLEVYRTREGFTRAEATDLEVTFRRYAGEEPGTGLYRISCFDAGRAMTWLGYRCPYEAYQLLFAEVDLGDTGFIGLSQFLKLVRMHRVREVEEIRTSLLRLAAADVTTDPTMVSATSLRKSLDFFGGDGSPTYSRARSRDPLQRKSTVLEELSSRRSSAYRHDEYTMIRVALQQRAKVRASCQEHSGYTPAEVVELRKRFTQYDANGNDDINQAELRILCQDLFPEIACDAKSRPELLRILQDVDAKMEGHLGFLDFLKLLRILDDSKKKAKQKKERRAVDQLEFTKLQIHEFREVFVANDKEGKDALTYQQVLALLAAIVPVGHRRAQIFREIWQKQANPYYGDADSADAEDWQIDFSDFLILMQRLLDIDFAGIKQRSAVLAEQIAAKQASQRRATAKWRQSGLGALEQPSSVDSVLRRKATRRSLTLSRKSFLKVAEVQDSNDGEEASDDS